MAAHESKAQRLEAQTVLPRSSREEAMINAQSSDASRDEKPQRDSLAQGSVVLDPAAERRLRLKIDLFIVPTVSLLYLFCFIDRANLGNAKIAGLDRDLGMRGYDYNRLISVFYVSYILFEIPGTLCCKWLGPGWFLPLSVVLFGVASVCNAFVTTLPQAMGVRFLLGVFEAGMMPGIAYYLSRWYRRAELAFRLSLYIVMAPLAGAFGGLLASAILTLDHVGGLRAWRMIFAVEGVVTVGLGLLALATLTGSPLSARWLSREEKALAVARVESERMGAAMLDAIDGVKLRRGVACPVTLATALVFLLNNVTVQSLAFFAPTIVQTIYGGATVVRQQLYTVPPYVVGGFFTVLLPLMSWRVDRRLVFCVLSAPLVMVGYCIFLGTRDATARYAATFLIASSAFAFGPLTNAHVSANIVSDTARSAAIGLNVMCGNVGGLIAAWAFLPWDAPDYHVGNGLNLATASMTLVASALMWAWMKRDNRKREGRNVEAELSALTSKQVEDLDWKHPAFRWKT
ncbi:putative transporter [Metarhizium anisopliae]|nr:putative transporter [Metarhizium anisopliae]